MNNGQLQLDEKIIGSCGKLMLLDRMLTQLIKDDHKVGSAVTKLLLLAKQKIIKL